MNDRNKHLIELCEKGYSQAEIARIFNISRQRVNQILSSAKTKYGLNYLYIRGVARDSNKCRHCGSKKDLGVHHKKYLDVGLDDLITLCTKCHFALHRSDKT